MIRTNLRFWTLILTAGVFSARISPGAVMEFLDTGQPTANGTVSVTVTDVNTGISITGTANNILAADTPAQKATKIDAALNAAINRAFPGGGGPFTSGVAGNEITVTDTGARMQMVVAKDTTGEGGTLKVFRGEKGTWWRYFFGSNTILPPSGYNAFATISINGSIKVASVEANGSETVNQLQQSITKQFQGQGINWTPFTNPATKQTGLVSQTVSIPSTGSLNVAWSPGYSNFLGTWALEGDLLLGDANGDGTVGFTDLLTLAQHYGHTGAMWADGDFNGDGKVDFADLLSLAQNYGTALPQTQVAEFAQVPEPALATLAFMSAALLIRSRPGSAGKVIPRGDPQSIVILMEAYNAWSSTAKRAK